MVGAVFDPRTDPVTAARLGLEVLEAVEPKAQVTVSAGYDLDPEGVASLPTSALLSIAEQWANDPSPPLPNGSIEPLPGDIEA